MRIFVLALAPAAALAYGDVADPTLACIDTEGYADEFGYDCSINVGYNCLDLDQFLAWGFTFDQWLEVLHNCPLSCGLDCISETCDASSLLENAADFGSCSAELTSGTSCTNIPRDGFSCTPSICVHGVLLAGVCEDAVPTSAPTKDSTVCVDAVGEDQCHVGLSNNPNFCEELDFLNLSICDLTCGRCTRVPTAVPTSVPTTLTQPDGYAA